MTTEEYEPIVLALPSSGEKIHLSAETVARVWDAVRRGEASSPEELITRAFDRWLEKLKLETPQPETAPGAAEGDLG
jgi:hypothetical protein